MTKIYLHGILEKEYQKFFCLNLKNASDLIDAIDCNRQGFKARLINLQNKCFFYDIIVNKKRVKSFQDLKEKPKRIDLVPAIAGAGIFSAIGAVVSAVLAPITAVTSFVGQTLSAGFSALTGSLGGGAGAAAGAGTAAKGAGVFGSIAKSVGLAAIASMLAPKPDLGLPAQQEISAVANALTQSYIFSSKTNLAQQGSFLPIGYGRLKVGSAVVQSCIKSFPLIVPDEKALQSNTFISKSTNIDAPISANSFVL
jgi:predicted phage tail protein